MQSRVTSVTDYIATLPNDLRAAIEIAAQKIL
jgi:hypothetical protein